MPRIDDFKFKKKERRPWNVLASEPIQPEVAAVENSKQEQMHDQETIGGGDKNNINKTDLKVTQNYLKTDLKVTQNYLKTDLNKPSKNISFGETDLKVTSKEKTNYLKTDLKVTQNREPSSLAGQQRDMLLFLFSVCKKNGDLITPPLSIGFICEQLKCCAKSAKTAIYYLEKMNLVSRCEFKNGRGGWTKYKFEKTTYQELQLLETDLKVTQNYLKTDLKVTSKLTQTVSSSSSLNKTITGEEMEDNQKELLPEGGDFNLKPEWAEVDISPLAFIGFSKHHLIQIIRQGVLTPDLVQDSIYAYAFDLQINERGKGINSPINFIMGILRKGMPYTPPDNYVSPRQQAINKIIEARKREKEAELAMQESDFQLWLDKTPRDKKAELAGDIFGMAYDEKNPMILAKLREKWSNLLE